MTGENPERRRQSGVEGGQLQLLIEDADEEQVDHAEQAHHPDRLRSEVAAVDRQRVEGDELDVAEEDGVRVEMDVGELPRHQHRTEGEHRREDDPDRRAAVDEAGALDGLDRGHRGDCRQRGSDETGQQVRSLRQDVPRHQTGQRWRG